MIKAREKEERLKSLFRLVAKRVVNGRNKQRKVAGIGRERRKVKAACLSLQNFMAMRDKFVNVIEGKRLMKVIMGIL
jgi:hypothetical protein